MSLEWPAARIGDQLTHDLIVPSPVAIGPAVSPPPAGPVFIEMMPAAYVTCAVVCGGAVSGGVVHPPGPPMPALNQVVAGSPTVFIHLRNAARWSMAPGLSGDVAACGAFLGTPPLYPTRTVFIGNFGAGSAGPPGVAAQIATMIAAKRSGKPFCEMCMPAAMAEAASIASPAGAASAASRTAEVASGPLSKLAADAVKSPTLSLMLDQLRNAGWGFEFGKPGSGSQAVAAQKLVLIDPSCQASPQGLLHSVAQQAAALCMKVNGAKLCDIVANHAEHLLKDAGKEALEQFAEKKAVPWLASAIADNFEGKLSGLISKGLPAAARTAIGGLTFLEIGVEVYKEYHESRREGLDPMETAAMMLFTGSFYALTSAVNLGTGWLAVPLTSEAEHIYDKYKHGLFDAYKKSWFNDRLAEMWLDLGFFKYGE